MPVSIILALVCNIAFAAKITLSFDDAPLGDRYFTGIERTDRLIGTLKRTGVREAVFYINPGRNIDAAEKRFRIMKYSQAGHIIANHTYDHMDLNANCAEKFIEVIRIAEELLGKYPTFNKWFRYPYLRESARDKAKHDAVKNYLKSSEYRLGYVTVDLYDWHLDALFNEAVKNNRRIDFAKLKALYLRIISESLDFYDDIARRALGYSPVHVLLLHEIDLNALFLEDVIRLIRGKNFQIVEAHKAFEDPIAHPKWDRHPNSMSRLKLMALQRSKDAFGYSDFYWTNTKNIDQAVTGAGIFGP
jgi:peptidoglycan-N-acetylglucosamine deacetylase